MIVELISVGTELLLGNIVNTNAQYLAKQLATLGLDCYYQTTVGDNPGTRKCLMLMPLSANSSTTQILKIISMTVHIP